MISPAAEVDVGEQLVRTLLDEQHPDLAGLPIREVGAGWDNTLWRLGDDLLVRLPRRAIAAPLIQHEQRWLPHLAPRLPLPVPAPVRVGRPSTEYAWPWSVVPWLGGTPGDRTPLTDPDDAAERLGRFLRALHHQAPPEAPHNPYRGVSLTQRADTFAERVVQLAAEIDRNTVSLVWIEALGAAPWSGPPVWVHGDLHPDNTLIIGGTLAAVIDFGDLCAGDPATDVGAAWMLLPSRSITRFATAYGGLDPDLEARAKGWALLFALLLLGIGLEGRPSYEAVARATLGRLAEADIH